MVQNTLTRREFEQVCRDFEKIVFERQEENRAHNSYVQEEHEQQAIEDGDLERLEKSFHELQEERVGLLSRNPLRQAQDMAIVVASLASRSAIRGGVPAEIAFSLSDSFIQHVEAMHDPEEVTALTREMERHYCRLVHDSRERMIREEKQYGNPYVHQAKDYIFSHLHTKITVQETAKALHVSPNYLSAAFAKQEGISFTRYCIYEKINRAKNMLTYSDISCSDIAQYLGFSSQSHLNGYFKQATGYTLMQFRRRLARNE